MVLRYCFRFVLDLKINDNCRCELFIVWNENKQQINLGAKNKGNLYCVILKRCAFFDTEEFGISFHRANG